MIEVLRFSSFGSRREVVATAPTFAEAIELAQTSWPVLELELDGDFPDCADFITTAGEVYAIQPEGFRL